VEWICAVVPEQPTNLQGEAISPTSIQLTWDEPRERDGRAGLTVDSYELYYNDSHMRQNVRVTITPPVNSYRLDDLTPDTVYHIRVSARSTARGESASTPTIQVRTPDYGPSRRRTFLRNSSLSCLSRWPLLISNLALDF